MQIKCPACGEELHEVHFGDNIQRWRCMKCERIYSEIEYHIGDGELIRKHVIKQSRRRQDEAEKSNIPAHRG